MKKSFFFKNINILKGPNLNLINDSLLIIDGKIIAFGKKAESEALKRGINPSKSDNKLIAPMLVDIHSNLRDPLTGFEDNLTNFKARAKKSGYGTVALLPDSNNWRDKPEKIPFQNNHNSDINILFWGSFTLEDEGKYLSPHTELLESGSIGLSTSFFRDYSIILKGLSLDAINSKPILVSSERNSSMNKGFVNKDLKSIQSGFYVIDDLTKINEIRNINDIQTKFPNKKIIIKNICDSISIKEIKNAKVPILSTISWWSLLADTNNLQIDDIGWKSSPPIGSAENREELINYLENDFIKAIAVNSIALNDENTFLPINERPAGISSFELVLPLLWEEFITKRSWNIPKLWKYISFSPSKLLGITEESLVIGSKRWLLFDPDFLWLNNQNSMGYESPSNFPKKDEMIKGKVIEVGFNC